MRRPLSRTRFTVFGFGLVALLWLGCAAAGVVPVQQSGLVENPETGIALRIESVEDRRGFQDFAGRSLTPTLAGDDGDPIIRSRAVGRSTSQSGGAGPNVFLAPDLSVERIVAEAVSRALREAGFRVLEQGDAGYEGAVPLQVGIEQLWMMKNQPTSPAHAEVEIRVRIAGPLPGLERGAVVEVRKKVARGGWSASMWRVALEKGLDELTEAAAVELASVRSSLDASPLARPAADSGSASLASPLSPRAAVAPGWPWPRAGNEPVADGGFVRPD